MLDKGGKGKVLKMEQVERIKELQALGLSTSDIAKKLSIDWKTADKYMKSEDFSPKTPVVQQRSSKLDPWKETIDKWLEEDRKNRYKQRHTAQRIYDRLCREYPEFTGSYSIVQRYVKTARGRKHTDGFHELVWAAGEVQADFGEADFQTPDGKRALKYLCCSFPYSNAGFTQVFGGETAECVCQGLQDIFEWLGGVPVRIVFDNATGVGRRFKDVIQITELFRRFKAHYGFLVSFCNPDAGHEKGNVERKTGYIRSNIFVPVPSISLLPAYNRQLFRESEALLDKPHYKKGLPIKELFRADKAALLPLPAQKFNVCRYEWLRTDGYGKVCLDSKHYYSTAPELAGQEVLLAIRAHTIEVLQKDGSVLVTHNRIYSDERTDSIDYSTSLALLLKRIGAWPNSGIRAQAPEKVRQALDAQNREELRKSLLILKELSERYDFATAISAMEEAIKRNSLNFSDTAVLAARLAGVGLSPEPGPDLTQYDKLLLFGGVKA